MARASGTWLPASAGEWARRPWAPSIGSRAGVMRLAGKTIHFFSMIPLYPEALALKLRDGTDALIEGLDAAVLSDVVDPARKNVVRMRFGLF